MSGFRLYELERLLSAHIINPVEQAELLREWTRLRCLELQERPLEERELWDMLHETTLMRNRSLRSETQVHIG